MIKRLVFAALLVPYLASAQPAHQAPSDPQKDALMQIVGELTLAQINWRTEVNSLRMQLQLQRQVPDQPPAHEPLKQLVPPEKHPARLPDSQLAVPIDPNADPSIAK